MRTVAFSVLALDAGSSGTIMVTIEIIGLRGALSYAAVYVVP